MLKVIKSFSVLRNWSSYDERLHHELTSYLKASRNWGVGRRRETTKLGKDKAKERLFNYDRRNDEINSFKQVGSYVKMMVILSEVSFVKVVMWFSA
ncbi:hypothetical protein [Halalkalibacter sp. APA_J-10(15)]|uniref:hypothetical protein n=1 Tax=Halalkalibacter sp. APA_J-10(15) TaxID=2933805 RepID=UPI001FF3260A|nr:hypothetical protein [Halalkalibacter sp. APA_J-10(15)]